MKSACHHSAVKQYENGYYCTVCFKEYRKERSGVFLLLLCSVLLLAPCHLLRAPQIDRTIPFAQHNTVDHSDIVPTDSTLLTLLVQHGCVLPAVAIAQARIESANYTSDIATGNKNLFGIKAHKCKYVSGVRKGHATFATYKDNVACYCHIQERYLNKIHKSYAEDSLYIHKVKRMK